MISVQTAALNWIRRALREEIPSAPIRDLAELAEELHWIAKEEDYPVEQVVEWIHEAEEVQPAELRLHIAQWKAERAVAADEAERQ